MKKAIISNASFFASYLIFLFIDHAKSCYSHLHYNRYRVVDNCVLLKAPIKITQEKVALLMHLLVALY